MSSTPSATRQHAAVSPLQRLTTRESTLQAVREMILSGQLEIGQPLSQNELASQLGISRTPLREALQSLAAEGLVRIDPYRGAVVAEFSVQQLLDTYQIREALEVVAGREAATLSTREHSDRVAAVLKAMARSASPDEWADWNTRFHTEVYSVVANQQLLDLIDMLRNRASVYIRMLARQDGPTKVADHSHEAMLKALRNNDADSMERLVREHLAATAKTVQVLLDETHNAS